jgi:hypothetical protein
MSQEHEPSNPSEAPEVSGVIHTEASPFEPGFKPGTVPHITVPDLPDDVQGLSAEAMSQVPTLTELVDEQSELEVEADESEPAVEPVEPDETQEPDQPQVSDLAEEAIQEEPPQADTWAEELQVRMGKLTDEIHTLHARLDALENQIVTKV